MGKTLSLRERFRTEVREIVFGLGDGLVSTLGAVTGIAGATFDNDVVLLAGFIVIAVEAISMGVGEYLSSKSERQMWTARVEDERRRVASLADCGCAELERIYRAKGLTDEEARSVAALAVRHPDWALAEFTVHHLHIPPTRHDTPVSGAVFMFFSYMIGGLVPLSPYLIVDVKGAIVPSIAMTAVALFTVGAVKGKLTSGQWLVSGIEMAVLSLVAAFVGLAVGQLVVSLQ